MGANISLGKMATLSLWLIANVGTEARRDEVRAVVESLDDLRWLCDDMLSEHLNLEAWAPVARERFLAAWRELKGGGAAARRRSSPPPGPPAQEAAPAPAPPAPPAPAPAEEEAELSDDNAAAPAPKRPRSDSTDDEVWSDGDDDDALARRWRQVMRDLIAKGLPGGLDACDAALYADEPTLMHKYTRGDGGVVYEYYAREDAQSETVCGARCFVRERFTHVNITDVALEGTTESTRREAPGVAEREGPCAALCPGG